MASNNAINAPLPLSATQGGTGLVSPTAHSLLVAEGASAFTALGSATNGQLPIGSTGADPVLATLTEGSGISITNAAGSITIAASGSGVAQSTGTWTPSLKAGGSSTGFSYSVQTGSYVLTGKWCQVLVILYLSAKPAGSGALTIGTLPFTSAASNTNSFSPFIYNVASYGKHSCYVGTNTTDITLRSLDANNNLVFYNLDNADITSSTQMQLSVGYYTA